MGLLDDVTGALKGAAGSQTGSSLASSVLGMLGSGGGLQGLVNALHANGLGDVVKSWIGTGANLPISAEQVKQALGPQVGQLAQQHGLSTDAVSSQLSSILPGLVDKLTPNGQLPTGGMLDQAIGLLRGKL
jgi:uncharacterized protein YidB (DUF937 family)